MTHRWCSAACVAAGAALLLGVLGGCARGPAPLLTDVQTAVDLGYRIGWQTDLELPADEHINSLTVMGDKLVVTESSKIIDAVETSTGEIRWRHQVTDDITDLTDPLEYRGDVVVCTDVQAHVIHADQGKLIQRFQLAHHAATSPVIHQGMLVLGTPTGRVFAQAARTGTLMWQYKMTSAITADPVLEKGFVTVADTTGNVAAINARNGNLVWRKFKPPWGAVETQIRQAGNLVFVACSDQKLYAFERGSGNLRWQYLTQFPLTRSPDVIGQHVFQHTREHGLVCLDLLTGEVQWQSKELTGTPFMRRGDEVVFHAPGQEQGLDLHFVRVDSGELARTVHLDYVDHVLTENADGSALYLADNTGRIMKLLPR